MNGCQVWQKCSCLKLKKESGTFGPGLRPWTDPKKLNGSQNETGRGRFGSPVLTKFPPWVFISLASCWSSVLSVVPKLKRNCSSDACSEALGKPNASFGGSTTVPKPTTVGALGSLNS